MRSPNGTIHEVPNSHRKNIEKIMKNGGKVEAYLKKLEDGGMPTQQQGGQEQQMQQIMQMVAQALQQGQDPQQIMQMLVQQGVPQQMAQQVIQQVMQQMQGQQQGPQEEMQEPQQEAPMQEMQEGMDTGNQQAPMMRFGGLPIMAVTGIVNPSTNNQTGNPFINNQLGFSSTPKYQQPKTDALNALSQDATGSTPNPDQGFNMLGQGIDNFTETEAAAGNLSKFSMQVPANPSAVKQPGSQFNPLAPNTLPPVNSNQRLLGKNGKPISNNPGNTTVLTGADPTNKVSPYTFNGRLSNTGIQDLDDTVNNRLYGQYYKKLAGDPNTDPADAKKYNKLSKLENFTSNAHALRLIGDTARTGVGAFASEMRAAGDQRDANEHQRLQASVDGEITKSTRGDRDPLGLGTNPGIIGKFGARLPMLQHGGMPTEGSDFGSEDPNVMTERGETISDPTQGPVGPDGQPTGLVVHDETGDSHEDPSGGNPLKLGSNSVVHSKSLGITVGAFVEYAQQFPNAEFIIKTVLEKYKDPNKEVTYAALAKLFDTKALVKEVTMIAKKLDKEEAKIGNSNGTKIANKTAELNSHTLKLKEAKAKEEMAQNSQATGAEGPIYNLAENLKGAGAYGKQLQKETLDPSQAPTTKFGGKMKHGGILSPNFKKIKQAKYGYNTEAPGIPVAGNGWNDDWTKQILSHERKAGQPGGQPSTDGTYNESNWIGTGAKRNIQEYIDKVKAEIPDFDNLSDNIKVRLVDYSFNTGRSVSDLIYHADKQLSTEDVNKNTYNTIAEDLKDNSTAGIAKKALANLTAEKLDHAKEDIYLSAPRLKNIKYNGAPSFQQDFDANYNPRINMWKGMDPAKSKMAVPTDEEIAANTTTPKALGTTNAVTGAPAKVTPQIIRGKSNDYIKRGGKWYYYNGNKVTTVVPADANIMTKDTKFNESNGGSSLDKLYSQLNPGTKTPTPKTVQDNGVYPAVTPFEDPDPNTPFPSIYGEEGPYNKWTDEVTQSGANIPWTPALHRTHPRNIRAVQDVVNMTIPEGIQDMYLSGIAPFSNEHQKLFEKYNPKHTGNITSKEYLEFFSAHPGLINQGFPDWMAGSRYPTPRNVRFKSKEDPEFIKWADDKVSVGSNGRYRLKYIPAGSTGQVYYDKPIFDPVTGEIKKEEPKKDAQVQQVQANVSAGPLRNKRIYQEGLNPAQIAGPITDLLARRQAVPYIEDKGASDAMAMNTRQRFTDIQPQLNRITRDLQARTRFSGKDSVSQAQGAQYAANAYEAANQVYGQKYNADNQIENQYNQQQLQLRMQAGTNKAKAQEELATRTATRDWKDYAMRRNAIGEIGNKYEQQIANNRSAALYQDMFDQYGLNPNFTSSFVNGKQMAINPIYKNWADAKENDAYDRAFYKQNGYLPNDRANNVMNAAPDSKKFGGKVKKALPKKMIKSKQLK